MNFFIVGTLILASVAQAKHPSYVPKCKHGDGSCLKKSANEVVRKYYAGLREINLLPFEPLHVKTIALKRNPFSPVSVDVKLEDADIIGLKNMKITSFLGFNKDFSGRTSFEAIVPELLLKGQYTINGRILIVPITGKGFAQLKARNMRLKYSFNLKPIEKEGKAFAVLEHVKLEMTPEHVQFHFDNLFNGDKVLGATTNMFLNENWREIYAELSPSFSKAISLEVKSLINTFFKKYPYAEYFV